MVAENSSELICIRGLNPKDCFLCEQHGENHCEVCPDAYNIQEYQDITDKLVQYYFKTKPILNPK